MTLPTPETAYRQDAKGRLVPETLVSPADRLIDQTVRTIFERAQRLSEQIARFKFQAYEDIDATLDLLTERYGTKLGGPRGNLSLTSFDACLRLAIAVQDRMSFGPELQIAKSLIDRCIGKWSDGARPEICALVEDAFHVSHEGKLNREALLRLRRLAIEDEDWRAAMAALTDSIRVVGSQEYLRLYRRTDPRARWEQLRLDLAGADLPEKEARMNPVEKEQAERQRLETRGGVHV